jgi:hypothetical protein
MMSVSEHYNIIKEGDMRCTSRLVEAEMWAERLNGLGQ